MPPRLSIVIPAFNEAARVQQSLRQIVNYLEERREAGELIVVDDGSADETAALAEEVARDSGPVSVRVIRYEENRGKGHAVRLGLLEAQANVVLFSDADLSTPITEVPKLIDPIREGDCDLTFGSRALDRRLIGVHQPWRREQGGRVFNLIVRLATGLPFWDTQCGFKAFRMSVCRPLIEAAQIDRFGFDVELIYLAHVAQLRLREIPVRWDHIAGGPLDASGNYSRDSLRMINEVRRIRASANAGEYSEAISAARTAAMVAAKHGLSARSHA
ncbi:MAG TPA: dolichyl-phosphate beta-glucosyltransferase [Pyrinomonadaceae bacterium]|nr:dolichyl-phosphate beta-glucosyltransferase [Pyrinomonadaceae bacterium]